MRQWVCAGIHLHIHLQAIYAYTYTNAYCNGDFHSHFHPNYNYDSSTNSDICAYRYCDDYIQANADGQAIWNAQGTTRPAAAPVAYLDGRSKHPTPNARHRTPLFRGFLVERWALSVESWAF
jgi:hypothetical protein